MFIAPIVLLCSSAIQLLAARRFASKNGCKLRTVVNLALGQAAIGLGLAGDGFGRQGGGTVASLPSLALMLAGWVVVLASTIEIYTGWRRQHGTS